MARSYPPRVRVKRRANGTLYLWWTEHGKTRKESARTNKVGDADRLAREKELELASVSWARPRRVTFHQAVCTWFEDRSAPRYGLDPKTLRGYRAAVELVLDTAPRGLRADQVSPAHVRELMGSLEERGLAAVTIRRYHVALSMIFHWLQRQGSVSRNPVTAVDPPRVPASTRTAASSEEFQAILDAAGAEQANPSRRASQKRQAQTVADLVTALWFSGLRSIEALRLTWADVDLDRVTWTIRSPRNKGGTVVLPVHREVVTMLRRRRLLGQAGPFQGPGDREAWRKFKVRNPELEQRHLHALRHSFVTRMVETGNLAAARHTGRHRTPEMTDLYTHVGPETFRAALEAL